MRRSGLGRPPIIDRRRRRRRRLGQNLPSFQQDDPKTRTRVPKGRSRRGQNQPEQQRNAQKGQSWRRDSANSLGRRSPTGEPSGRSGGKRPRLRRQAPILLRDVDASLERISEYSHFARRPGASRTTAQPGSRNRRRALGRRRRILGGPFPRSETRREASPRRRIYRQFGDVEARSYPYKTATRAKRRSR